jgi:hypothetical protein
MKSLLTTALLLAVLLLAQQAPIPDHPFAESIDVSVANVEVSALPGEGRSNWRAFSPTISGCEWRSAASRRSR